MTARKGQNIRPTPLPRNELTPREKITGQSPCSEQEEDEDGEEVADGAPREKAFPGPGGQNVRLLPDGTLKPEKAWALAVAWADGFRGDEAGEMAGKISRSYRSRIETNEVFLARVAELELEKTKLEHGGVGGEAIWAAKQNLRVARIGGVVAEVHRATLLYIETVKAFSGATPMVSVEGGDDGAAQEGVAVTRGPGRPAHQPRALRVDVLQMREGLINKGLAPQPVAAE